MSGKCTECKQLCSSSKVNCLKGEGPSRCKIMIVGEAPGEHEEEQKRPFVGVVGQFLRKSLLAPLNIKDDEVFITNAVRCRPPKNRTPNRKEITNCRKYLLEEVKQVRPKVMIVMGNTPLCSVLFLDKVQGITRWRGKELWSREFNCWIVPTFHPSALRYDKIAGSWFRYDQTIRDIKRALELSNILTVDDSNFTEPEMWTKPKDVVGVLREAIQSGKVSLDLETDLFDPRNDIIGLSLCYKGLRYYPCYIPFNVFEDEEAKRYLETILVSKHVVKIFHNVSFDHQFLHQHGFPLRMPYHDTMIMAHLLDENFSVGLKERTWIDLDFGGYDIELEQYKLEHKWTRKKSYKDIPVEILGKYAGIDALATYLLYEKYVPRLKEEHLAPIYKKISMPVRDIMTNASIKGMTVDKEKAKNLEKQMKEAMKILEENIYKIAGKEFNFNSTKQLSDFLFNTLKAPDMGKTKKGNWIMDKNVLAMLASKNEKHKYTKIAQNILKYKYIDKLEGTYIGQIVAYMWDDGKVHPSYNLTGTVSGRPSNSKPCTNNIPKDRLIRSLYRSSPGNTLVEVDLKQSEMRVMAAESGDKVLTSIILSGDDIHNRTYNEIFTKPKDYVPSQDQRRIAKAINFGLIYGITAVGLARRLKKTVEECEKYINLYFKRFSGVAKWLIEVVEKTRKTGEVVSLFGRKRRLPNILSDDKFERWRAERQAMNSPIQGTSSDYCNIVMIRATKMFKERKLKARIVHTVYDNVIVDTPMDEVTEVSRILLRAVRTRVSALPIQMDADVEVGERWGEHNESNLEPMLKEILNLGGKK